MHKTALLLMVGLTGLAGTISADEPPPAGRVNARSFGAIGDGEADDTAALQAALEAATAKGPVCFVPAGQYRLDGHLTVPPGVTLLGASGGTPHSEQPIGTVLLAYGGRGQADGPPLVTLKPNAVIRNLTIHYPEQTLPEVVPYPWTIRGDGQLCQVIDITMTNPYQALDFGTCWNDQEVPSPIEIPSACVVTWKQWGGWCVHATTSTTQGEVAKAYEEGRAAWGY